MRSRCSGGSFLTPQLVAFTRDITISLVMLTIQRVKPLSEVEYPLVGPGSVLINAAFEQLTQFDIGVGALLLHTPQVMLDLRQLRASAGQLNLSCVLGLGRFVELRPRMSQRVCPAPDDCAHPRQPGVAHEARHVLGGALG